MLHGMPEFTLYMAPASAPCRAVLLHHSLLGGMAPDLEIVPLDIADGAHKTPELLRNNPLHTVPTLVTPWGPLWESRAIMRFMESLCPETVGYPTATFHRAVVDRLLDWDLGTLYRCVSSIVYPKAYQDEEPAPHFLDALNDATRFLDQKQLGDGRAFLTGNTWTIADLSCHMTLSLLRLINLEVDDIPRIAEWNARMLQLPGWGQIDGPFRAWIDDIQGAAAVPLPEESDTTAEAEAVTVDPQEDATPAAEPEADDSDDSPNDTAAE